MMVSARPGPDNGTLANDDARADIGLGTHPCPRPNDDGVLHLPMMWIGDVMTRRTEKGTLAHRRIGPYMHGGGVIAIDSISQTSIIIHHQIPRHEDTCRRIDNGRWSNACTKTAEEPSLPPRHQATGKWTGQYRPRDNPPPTPQLTSTTVRGLESDVICISSLLVHFFFAKIMQTQENAKRFSSFFHFMLNIEGIFKPCCIGKCRQRRKKLRIIWRF